MNNRIKHLRKDILKLSQEAFGDAIKIKRSSISKIESGENNPSKQTISLICSTFKVNEDWLRNGTGEVFNKKEMTAIDEIAEKYQLDDIERKIITGLLSLSEDERKVIKKYILSLSENNEENNRCSGSQTND